ncbi:hypothetical protein BDZ89DRAFT_1061348 [Hymenopellis radicata]|nr:hypothetical protein BDZ89DRAFT_1061348 [Hymenopellis radicata]
MRCFWALYAIHALSCLTLARSLQIHIPSRVFNKSPQAISLTYEPGDPSEFTLEKYRPRFNDFGCCTTTVQDFTVDSTTNITFQLVQNPQPSDAFANSSEFSVVARSGSSTVESNSQSATTSASESTSPSPTVPSDTRVAETSHRVNIAAVVGASVGATLGAVALAGGLFFLIVRKRRIQKTRPPKSTLDAPLVTPFIGHGPQSHPSWSESSGRGSKLPVVAPHPPTYSEVAYQEISQPSTRQAEVRVGRPPKGQRKTGR